MTNSEQLILVNEQDEAIGSAEKLAVHEQGLLHRAFSIFLFRQQPNQPIELLIQQRHWDKYHCGGLWTNTCCSHPRPGESLSQATERRLREELGLSAALHSAGHFIYKAAFENGLTEHEFDHVFIGLDKGQPPRPHPNEISAVEWVAVPILQQSLDNTPERYTPWFKPALGLALTAVPNLGLVL